MSEVCSVRRRLFKGVGASLVLAGMPSLAMTSSGSARTLKLYNRHTGERVSAEFWQDGKLLTDGAAQLDKILRDHRANEIAKMDRKLFDLVYRLADTLDYDKEIHIISGFRSQKTNQMLAAKSGGVAKQSFHTKAQAIDIAMPGIELAKVRDAAKKLKLGGVGYYPSSGFVHVDTGRVRSW